MDRVIFLPGKVSPSAPVLATIPGTTTSPQILYFFFILQSRGGFSDSSTSSSIALAAGQGVQINVNASFIADYLTTASDWHRLAIAISDTDNASTASVVADISLQTNGNYVSAIAPVALATDGHFIRDRVVEDYASLPETGIVQGALGKVTGDRVYRWDGMDWQPYEVDRFSAYVNDLNTDIGAFRGTARSSGLDDAVISIAPIPWDGSLSEGVKIAAWREDAIVEVNTWVRVQIEVNYRSAANNKNWNYLFSGNGATRFGRLRYLGKCDRADWILNPTSAAEVDFEIDTVFLLPDEISATEAAVFEWFFAIDATRIVENASSGIQGDLGFRLSLEKYENKATIGNRDFQVFASQSALVTRSREGLSDNSISGYPLDNTLMLFRWIAGDTSTPVAGQILELNDGGNGRYHKIALSPDWGGLASFANIRAIADLVHGKIWHVLGLGLIAYDETLANDDDGENYFRPDAIAANENGRLVPVRDSLAANKSVWGDAIADITALANLPNPINGKVYPVGSRLYIKTANSFNGVSPKVLQPSVAAIVGGVEGSYYCLSNIPHRANTKPSQAPNEIGERWIAVLTNPEREVHYEAMGTSGASDWRAIFTIGDFTYQPVHAPDYVGQEIGVRLSNPNRFVKYLAKGTTVDDWLELSGGGSEGESFAFEKLTLDSTKHPLREDDRTAFVVSSTVFGSGYFQIPDGDADNNGNILPIGYAIKIINQTRDPLRVEQYTRHLDGKEIYYVLGYEEAILRLWKIDSSESYWIVESTQSPEIREEVSQSGGTYSITGQSIGKILSFSFTGNPPPEITFPSSSNDFEVGYWVVIENLSGQTIIINALEISGDSNNAFQLADRDRVRVTCRYRSGSSVRFSANRDADVREKPYPVSINTTNYTLAGSDRGTVRRVISSGSTITCPPNAVDFPQNWECTILNATGADITVTGNGLSNVTVPANTLGILLQDSITLSAYWRLFLMSPAS